MALPTRALLLALSAVLSLALVACGSDADAHNDADVAFASEMTPHHEQAVTMSRLATTNGASPEVQDLAARIEKAQGPEIEQMGALLEEWGEDAVHDMSDGHHGSGSMPGMLGEEDLDALRAARGAEFDRLFLTQMIAHHTGAIEMAQTEQEQGENAEAVELAGTIGGAQTSEIAEMKELLG